MDKSLSELHAQISRKVIGQDQLIEKLLITLQLQYLKNLGNKVRMPTSFSSNLLIIGGTGTGKTMAVREAVKCFGFHLIELDAKQFGMGGSWAGKSFDKFIDEQRSIEPFRTVVFIDEFDKIIRNSIDSNDQNVNLSVQETLLKHLEGAKTSSGIDLSNMVFIMAGSFSAMQEKSPKTTMGFFKPTTENIPKSIQERLVEHGMMEELLGRIQRVVITNPVTKELLTHILQNEHNVLQQYQQLLDLVGVRRSEYILNAEELVDRALQLNVGVRGLNQVLMEEIDKQISNTFTDKSFNDSLNPFSIYRLS